MNEISLDRIIKVVKEIKERVKKYSEMLKRNEMLVRYILVDPLLRALGWNLEDPEEVLPEDVLEEGKPDYTLRLDGKSIAFLEVKSLGNITEEVVREKLKYSFEKGVRYTIITDGDLWLIYDAFKSDVEWRERKVSEWRISKLSEEEVAFEALIIANIRTFGKRPREPIMRFDLVEETRSEGGEEAYGMKPEKVKGPLSKGKAKILVLHVLSQAARPLGRKEIVERVRELVELMPHDREKLKSGMERWESVTRWGLSDLKKEGFVENIGRNRWVITDKGRLYLTRGVSFLHSTSWG